MEKFKLYFLNNKKTFIIVGCLLAIAICSIGCYFYYQHSNQNEVTIDDTLFNDIESDFTNDDSDIIDNNETNEELEDEVNKEEDKEVIEYIYVDIKGYVNKPGVYKVEKHDNKRIYDLITLAGGVKKDADTSIINLSTKLKDEMVVIIYSKKEIEDFIKTKETLKDKIEICDKEEVKNDACIIEDDVDNKFESDKDDISNENNDSSNSNDSDTNGTNNKNDTNNNETTNGKVNINTASLELLTTLSGIGESKAQAIIDYRNEIGLFETIDDIKNVSGIGESAFEKIKDSITVK